uniref:Uncharacterized protein n=1 Tax=Thermogemmatispora argillosa TaxID=2045280 RepID=A0A455SY13_9CHLR|nr:hypothetical protein KTA_14460 [Thermogemmatispora argillosa]
MGKQQLAQAPEARTGEHDRGAALPINLFQALQMVQGEQNVVALNERRKRVTGASNAQMASGARALRNGPG